MLEDLWRENPGRNYAFFKGLIQLAGAFVHVRKQRKQPALALFKLARKNLEQYGSPHLGVTINEVLFLIDEWERKMESPAHAELEIAPNLRCALLSPPLSRG